MSDPFKYKVNDPYRNRIDYLLIPIDLFGFALKKKCVNQVKLFIVLKSLYNDRFPLNKESIALICSTAKYKSKKTFYTNLKWLVSHKWVTFSKEYCVLKGFNKLRVYECFNSRKGVQFTPFYDLDHFRPFVYGAVISYCMKHKWFADRESGIDKRNPIVRSHCIPVSYDLPLAYLSLVLNISKATASNYKKLAKNSGYIDYKKDYEVIENVSPLSYNSYRRYADNDDKHRLRFIKGNLCLQLSDKITSNMVVKTKRNLRRK